MTLAQRIRLADQRCQAKGISKASRTHRALDMVGLPHLALNV